MTDQRWSNDRAALLLVARHAPVDAPGVCYGQKDVPATMSDEQAVEVFLDALARGQWPFERATKVWSSPLRRCAGPATHLASRIGAAHVVDSRLSELSFGAWEGRRYDDLEREDPRSVARFFDGWAAGAAPPGGEGIVELESRVRAWLGQLAPGVQLLVAHAGVVRALRVILLGTTWSDVMATAVEPLAVEAFRWQVVK